MVCVEAAKMWATFGSPLMIESICFDCLFFTFNRFVCLCETDFDPGNG